jgi:hypothetical protein
LMADSAAALRESRRVLREGEPVAFTVFAIADRNPWSALPAMTLVRRGHLPKLEPPERRSSRTSPRIATTTTRTQSRR